MHTWIFAEINFFEFVLNGVRDKPETVMLGVALIVFLLTTRAWLKELSESRKMLNEASKSGNEHETKTLDMATNAINKIDRLADSMTDIATAMRESSANYSTAAQANSEAHVKTTNMLVDRIRAMDEKRAEDEIYSNDKLLASVNSQIVQGQETIARVVGAILSEARVLHEETRQSITNNNEVLMLALRASPPPTAAVESSPKIEPFVVKE
jgi:hypothetical protein